MNDAATDAEFRLLRGRRDSNGADLAALHDGRLPESEDDPRRNFFFAAGSDGGRLLVDLKQPRTVAQVNTYSWHAGERGPQVYTLYAAVGTETGFQVEAGGIADPTQAGWVRLAVVDTRTADAAEYGGQYGVQVAAEDSSADCGRFRYLLFDVRPTDPRRPFGQTFFSEIDVIDREGPKLVAAAEAAAAGAQTVIELEGGKTRITIDKGEVPDLATWVESELVPMIREWYPEIERMLPSAGYEAPRRVRIVFASEGDGVAATSGTRVTCWAKWFRANLETEAKGAVLHELVHVVQQYDRRRAGGGARNRPPGWLVEGLADYVRWFRYEPRSGGALIAPDAAARVRYDASYRVTANFLNWVTEEYGPQVYRELNAAMREGRYDEASWKTLTGHSASELGEAWKAGLARQRKR